MDIDFGVIIAFLIAKFSFLMPGLAYLGGLIVVAQIVVLMTPTKKDDAAWAKIQAVPVLGRLLIALEALSPWRKK